MMARASILLKAGHFISYLINYIYLLLARCSRTFISNAVLPVYYILYHIGMFLLLPPGITLYTYDIDTLRTFIITFLIIIILVCGPVSYDNST